MRHLKSWSILASVIYFAGCLIFGIICCLTGRIHPTSVIGLILSAAGIIVGVVKIRCPFCRKYLGIFYSGDFCPYCGSEVDR